MESSQNQMARKHPIIMWHFLVLTCKFLCLSLSAAAATSPCVVLLHYLSFLHDHPWKFQLVCPFLVLPLPRPRPFFWLDSRKTNPCRLSVWTGFFAWTCLSKLWLISYIYLFSNCIYINEKRGKIKYGTRKRKSLINVKPLRRAPRG